MDKIKIGIPLDSNFDPLSGGSYSYTYQLIKAIDEYAFDEKLEIVFLNFKKKEVKTQKTLITFDPFSTYSIGDLIRKVSILLLNKISFNPFKKFLKKIEFKHTDSRNQKIKAALNQNNIKVLFHLHPDGNTYNFPFITIHWDIGHLSTYMFPEFTEEFETRNNYYNNVLPKALMIITETEFGKQELIAYSKINKNRIGVMPIFPGEVILENIPFEIQKKILVNSKLESKQFFIYPAQFWAHKNHTLLIDAFDQVLTKYPNLKLILTGSDKGNLQHIKNYIQFKNLDNQVLILGFVTNAKLFTYYKNAIALVMPTYLGPSNMPPLEAAFLNCPVILSDIKGHRELMGDYAHFFAPSDINTLVKLMLNQIEGKEQKQYQNKEIFNINNALATLEQILLKTAVIRKNWH